MKVAILYSGGKDSTYAIDHAIQKKWDIRYLVSVKPNRKDCYLFHYATVEHTKELANIIGYPHFLIKCKIADPKKEAALVKEVVVKQQKKDPINALILGGVGLQETQLRSIQDALRPLGIEVFASHAGEEHDIIMQDMLDKGFEIYITQVASDGLMPWLGKKITKENFKDLKKDSVKYKFHIGAEGGYYDTLVTDTAFFSKRLIIKDMEIVKEDAYCGHVNIKKFEILDKKERQEIKN